MKKLASPLSCGPKCSSSCSGAKLALSLPLSERRKKAGFASLIALLFPGLGFPLGLVWLASSESCYEWLLDFNKWPWEFWSVAFFGTSALAGGCGDWAFHRWISHCVIGKAEKRCELLALAGGGVPLFLLMCAASINGHPLVFLIPVIVVLLFTCSLICYDEFVYHRRRCRKLETFLHRTLVFGNGLAFLAWANWCFVKGGLNGHA